MNYEYLHYKSQCRFCVKKLKDMKSNKLHPDQGLGSPAPDAQPNHLRTNIAMLNINDLGGTRYKNICFSDTRF